jgi:hypothetical protein
MLTESQIKTLQHIAERRIKEGRGSYFETRAQFAQLMGAALSTNPTLTEKQFLKEALEVMQSVVNKKK